MASVRSRSQSMGRSGDGAKRMGAYMQTSKEEFPPVLSRNARKDVEPVRLASQVNTQTKGTTRIPQTASVRRPSGTVESERPLLAHQQRPWAPNGSGGSGRLASNIPPSSTPSASVKLDTVGARRPMNVLRRKHSVNLSQEAENIRNESRTDSNRTSSSSSIPRSQTSLDTPSSGPVSDYRLMESPMEIRTAKKVELPTTNAHTVTIYPELDRYRDIMPPPSIYDSPTFEVPYRIATQDLPPPTPLFSGTSSQISGLSGSPSTRFSESPGPGPYSRDTTPTSISSHSPGLIAPMRGPAPRIRQPSPAQTRPPIARRRAGSIPNDADTMADRQGLAVVRESLTSSSSNSTVRDADKKERKKKKGLPPLAPNPPPRKSSQKFKKTREEESPSKPSRDPAPLVMTSAPQVMKTFSETRKEPVTSPRATPPVRPSRDGTPDLQSQLGLPLPVIHSNLSSSSLSERRQSIGIPPSLLNRSMTPATVPDRLQPQARLPIGREPTPISAQGPRGGAPTGNERNVAKPVTGRTTRTPSPSVSTFKNRFPLFGRRTKTAPEVPQVDTNEKLARKGPKAGTGHEGYGRIGSVRRRSSSVGNIPRAIPGTMSSQESLGSNQSHDLFLMERMNPVVIAGGEIIENRNTSSELSRTESNQSLPLSRPSVESKNGSQISLSSREGTRTTLWPSSFSRGAKPAALPARRRPSDSSDSEVVVMKSTLAFRRSIQRLRSPDQQPVRLPKPIVTRPQGVTSPSVNSLDTSVLSDDSLYDRRLDGVHDNKEIATIAPKKLTKRAKSPRKWNIFGRSQSQPPEKQSAAKKVAATVKVVQTKPVAYYTMMDSSEQEDGEALNVEDVLREAQVLPPASPQVVQDGGERRPSVTYAEKGDVLVETARSTGARDPRSQPAPAPTNVVPPTVQANQLEASTAPRLQAQPSSGRPSRLPQVGRIPKVVSARPEQTSPKSFSRPFNRVSMQVQLTQLGLVDTDSVAKGPSPPRPSTPELTQDESTITSGTNNSMSRYRLSKEFATDRGRVAKEFLSFSPRQSSQFTTTTTSSSSGVPTFADATAVIPAPHAPLVEDEIWDEYNDLLGEDTLKVPPSAGSSQGTPFHLEGYGSRLKNQIEKPLESPTINIHAVTRNVDEVIVAEKVPVASSVYSTELTMKLNEALDAAPHPTTPFSVSEFVSGYGDRNNSVDFSKRLERASPDNATRAVRRQRPRRSDGSGSTGSQASDDNSPLSQVNLRVGSMTVSKWLTFGHVLFSPARDELVNMVGSLKRHSILVVDGLGNDDWSFYAAETYPAATFFNLSPRAPLPADHQSSATFPLSPPNHHQIQYLSHMDKFPFGPQSFTSVVFRFPAAAPENHYRNIISEARRVLKPGGYIELSILDVDLNNMGNRGRRAVRRLKELIHTRAADTSLGSTADLILRLLGRRGFADIKTCRVGVPVATPIARSSASETSASANWAAPPSSSPSASGRPKEKPKKDDRSLAEMMSDESPVADESITKMVAKVGRWWYSKCYESAAAPTPGSGATNSMWSDPALLAECEEWGTSLKLMVCHARVPDGRGRVASI